MDAAVAALVARLEAVTSRLEAVEKQIADGGSPSVGSAAASAASETVASPAVQDFQDLVNQYIPAFVAATEKIGDAPLKEQAALVAQALQAQVDFLKIAAASKKPSDDVFAKLLKPTSDLMAKIGEIREKSRASKLSNHLSAVSEGIGALGWVAVAPTPGPFVTEAKGSSEFWSNRILKDFKGKEQDHVDWVNAYNGFLKDLVPFIKKHHTTGVAWNPRGGDASAANVSAPAAAPAAGGAPAPPPPPPADFFKEATPAPANKAPATGALFAELAKGEAVTAGLRKVTKDMKTKNRPDEERSSVVPAVEKKPVAAAAPAGAKKLGPAKLALEGNRWVVENQVGQKSLVVEASEAKQTVYIYRCRDSVVQIKGKVNAINLDECVKTAVVFDDAIASFEAVNCKSVEVQVIGRVPSFAIDKTDGFLLHLSKASLGSEIVTSKSSEMNVSIPVEGAEDPVEVAIPEQFKTIVNGSKLHTTIVEHV
eukprot:TRINITY_DN3137_c0_g1_i1.p1 TRINITY_DN3137_c0_g1~~TRINITY_DN3137_c0_g1_i1.p1  ORF type:complete len:481 (-),score=149.54 TRINITY_DN3137_c0_g1_i1:2091-3533(-)